MPTSAPGRRGGRHESTPPLSEWVRVAAVDLGATSGRVVVVEAGADHLQLTEVHRFPHSAVLIDGHLHWDLVGLYREVLTGLHSAAATGPLDGVGIDSWAVDYGLLDGDGQLIGLPFSYRDHRTDGVAEAVTGAVGSDALYDVNGLQQLPFTTLYQLVAARDTIALATAENLLLLPDLLIYWLTGRRGTEHTNASTTGLYDARSRGWSSTLTKRAGVPEGLLGPLWVAGHTVGPIRDDLGIGLAGVPVIVVGSHDTASAVVATPGEGDSWAYLSSGTWSLIGLELPEPVLSAEARAADFSNEAGIDRTIRFLKNVMGLWVLSQTIDTWATEGRPAELQDLIDQARQSEPRRTVIDIDDSRLLPPGDMPARIGELAQEAGEPLPRSRAEMIRCILDSLALAYRRRLRQAVELAGRQVSVLHVVGGGSQNTLLAQLTADACGVPVLAGPVEASVMGNALVQARTLGVDLPDLAAMRQLVRTTHPMTRYDPRDETSAWASVEERVHRPSTRRSEGPCE